MNKYFIILFSNIHKAKERGAIDILLTSLFNKVIVFVSNIIVIRLLEKTEYGVFAYSYNILSIIAIVSSIGIDSAMFQYCCEERPLEERRFIAKKTFFIGVASNTLFAIITSIVAVFLRNRFPEGKNILSVLVFALPLMCIFNFQKYWLRIKKENLKFGILTNIYSISYLIASSILIVLFNLSGAVLGVYLGLLLPIIFGFAFTRKIIYNIIKNNYSDSDLIKEVFRYGALIAITNGVGELLYYLDVMVIGLVTTDSVSVAYYKSATIIPRVLTSFPAILVLFIYPYFAYNKDRFVWVKRNVIKIQLLLTPFFCVLTVLFIVKAKWIMKTLYGPDYTAATLQLQILLVSAFFSCAFRIVSGNILAMLRKVKENFYIGCVECVLNIILDYCLIKKYGNTGAAIATLSVTICSSLMCNAYLFWYLSRNIRKQAEESNPPHEV